MSKATKNISRNDITRKLRTGEITKLAEKTGYSASHVSNVLAGRRNNSDILNAAAKLTSRRK
jgi:uncharacterized protein YidB (DUF937 family)